MKRKHVRDSFSVLYVVIRFEEGIKNTIYAV